jgi:hypothetical protein
MQHRASRMLAATLVLVGVTSCGSGGSSTTEHPDVRERGGATTTAPDALETVKEAVATSNRSDSARFSGSFFFDANALGTDDPADGTVSMRAGAASYVVDMQKETEGLVPPSTPRNQLQMRVRDVNGKLYLQFPAAFASAGIGNSWVAIPSKSAPEGVQLPPGFSQVSQRPFLAARLLRPSACFDVIDSATSARLVGKESVRGDETTRYALQWAPRAWVEDAGLFFFFGKDRSAGRLATLDEVLNKSSIADVWIDAQGRVRRVIGSADLTLIAPYFDPPGDPNVWKELRTKCEFYDYGAKVPTATVPSAVVTSGTGGT